MNRTVRNIVVLLICCLISFGIVGCKYNNNSKENAFPEKYMVASDNHNDIQSGNDCAGYAAAYLMRSYGEDADGHSIYEKIKDKTPDGGVTPESLVNYLNSSGYNASLKFCTSINDLKQEVSKGYPVIVFVKLGENQPFHYTSVVGYDKYRIFISESVKDVISSDNKKYNRIQTIDDFMQTWNVEYEGKSYLLIQCSHK